LYFWTLSPGGVSGLPSGASPGWQMGESSPNIGGHRGNKIPGVDQNQKLVEGSKWARGRNPRQKITWPSRLGVECGANDPIS
jgi:hypothetical protein